QVQGEDAVLVAHRLPVAHLDLHFLAGTDVGYGGTEQVGAVLLDQAGTLADGRRGLVGGAGLGLLADLALDQAIAHAQGEAADGGVLRQGQQVAALAPLAGVVAIGLPHRHLGQQAVHLQVHGGVHGQAGDPAVLLADLQAVVVLQAAAGAGQRRQQQHQPGQPGLQQHAGGAAEHAGFAGDSVAVHGGLPVCGAMTAPAAAGSGAGRGQDGDEMWQFAGNPLPRPGALASLAAMSRTVAIVEDEPAIRDNYAEALRRHGYAVETYASRAEARTAFALKLPDLVIIDVGLGDEPEGGFDLCRELRARSASLPILFLTARDSDFDVISGLRLGAD